MIQVSHRLGDLLQLTEELLVVDGGRVVGHGGYPDLIQDATVLPTLRRRGVVNRLRGRTTDTAGVVRIADTAIEFVTPGMDRRADEAVTLEFDPADVALARRRVEGTSIGNQIEGVVTRWTDDGAGVFVEVRLGTDGSTIAAEVGRESLAALGIEVGRPIVCLLKRQAIRVR
jgi:molybdate transport system ATP-binding protein